MVCKQATKARRPSLKRRSKDARPQLCNADLLRRALDWIVGRGIFDHLPRHGNTGWLPTHLMTLAIVWVWSEQTQLTAAFDQARRTTLTFYESLSLLSYQGFLRALVTWNQRFCPLLRSRLRQWMEQVAGKHWRVGEHLVLAVDGSRVTTPRTKSNEQAFAAKNFGFGEKARRRWKWKNKKRRIRKLGAPVKPQIRLTLIWHLGLKMPWCWRTGPSTASERGHFLEMLQSTAFPPKTLFCADAGFVGYELWKAVMDGGHDFLIRVGGNVHLLRQLGRVRTRKEIVHFWPREVRRREQSPLMLRLLTFQGLRGPVSLLTSVLEAKRLSAVRAGKLYRQRWGVELQFRTLKQTFGRTKLRSRTAERALVELDWSLLGLWIIQLFAVQEQIEIAQPPERSSAATAIGIFRDLVRDRQRIVAGPKVLKLRLRAAVKDDYRRRKSKPGRYRIPFQDAPTAGGPQLHIADAEQRRIYHTLVTAA